MSKGFKKTTSTTSRKKNVKTQNVESQSSEMLLNENQKKMVGRLIHERKNEGFSLIDQYFDLQIEFEQKFGENTIVLMQVGDFFECYGVSNHIEQIGNVQKISDFTGLTKSRRNKNILENSRENALMCGFPLASLKKYLNILIQHSYTVVLIEQITRPPEVVVRQITGIHSPGTYIEDVQTSDPNFIVSIYMDENTCYRTGSSVYLVGLSAIELSTGNCVTYQTKNHLYDKKAILEEMYRFVESFNPKEILYREGNIRTIHKDDVIEHLNMINRTCHDKNTSDFIGNITLLQMNEFLSKIYTDHGFLTPIEYLNLERTPEALLSFLFLLEFSYHHNENILKKIKKPETWEYHDHLILYHNTIYQLNIIPSSTVHMDHSSKYKSLFDVIQKTSTPMGRRLLKYRMMNPITSIDELNRRYNFIEHMMSNRERLYEIERKLNEIMDIERMHRKMELGCIHPHEFGTLHQSYDKITSLIHYLQENHTDFSLENYGFDRNIYEQFIHYKTEFHEKFDMDEILKHALMNIQKSFFKPGTNHEIDDYNHQMNQIEEFFMRETNRLSNMIEMGSDFVKLENNERDGYFMTCTKKRSELLLQKMSVEEKRKYEIRKHQATTVKIISSTFEQQSHLYISLKDRIRSIVKDKFLEEIQQFVLKYDDVFKNITLFVSNIDVIKSCAKTSLMYGYHKPVITDKYQNQSFFEGKKIRHPLIEILNDKVVYVDNDLDLLKGQEECNGILLMGLNGVGKSSMAKAVGCNIVMAQMGMFVAAEEFVYYPYQKIFTRINGDDNIFRGMSSFVVEMNELRSILKYADERSIVLGDEVCKGTEETSALAIVGSTIKRFSERGVNFIMATHFHKLFELEDIQQCRNVRFKHLSFEYDEANDRIIYGRKLMDGPGDTLYGLEIASYLIKDMDFMRDAKQIRNEILEKSDTLISHKKSNYNSQLYVEECMICHKNNLQTELHTHHIIEQHEFEDSQTENIQGIRKNQLRNLVVLCEEHHEEVHHGNLMIHGWTDTSSGRILNWEYLSPSSPPTLSPPPQTNNHHIMIEIESDENTTFMTALQTESKEEEKEEKEEDWLESEIRKLKNQRIDEKLIVKNIKEKIKNKGEKVNLKKIKSIIDSF